MRGMDGPVPLILRLLRGSCRSSPVVPPLHLRMRLECGIRRMNTRSNRL